MFGFAKVSKNMDIPKIACDYSFFYNEKHPPKVISGGCGFYGIYLYKVTRRVSMM